MIQEAMLFKLIAPGIITETADKSIIIPVSVHNAGAYTFDRIRLSYVIDFIDLKFWPSFNIADSAITVGAVILAVYMIKKK